MHWDLSPSLGRSMHSSTQKGQLVQETEEEDRLLGSEIAYEAGHPSIYSVAGAEPCRSEASSHSGTQDKASVGSACQGQAPAAARLKARGRMSDKAAPMSTASRAVLGEVLTSTFYVTLWITLSGTVILYNKWILAYYGFPYPITLTMWHMLFSSVLAFACVRLGFVPNVNMTAETYIRAVLPIGALFACTLWLGNAAYLYLSVSFIQMLKALMPVAVFCTGCTLGLESFSTSALANMVVVTIGVAIASYGEINFVVLGVVLQLISVASESMRLSLVQILLQRRGLTLNPITTMYYIAPASFAFLSIPWFFIEAAPMLAEDKANFQPLVFLSNAAAAFGLNMAVFLLIGKTSALTMNVAGVLKDWLLIGLSVLIFKAQVTRVNLGGYLIAFFGVCRYNYKKLQAMQTRQAAAAAQQKADAEGGRMMTNGGGDRAGEKAPLVDPKTG